MFIPEMFGAFSREYVTSVVIRPYLSEAVSLDHLHTPFLTAYKHELVGDMGG